MLSLGHIQQCLETFLVATMGVVVVVVGNRRSAPASSRLRQKALPHTLQCTGQSPTAENDQALVNNDKLEKSNFVLSPGLWLQRYVSALYSLSVFYFLESGTPPLKLGRQLCMSSEGKNLSKGKWKACKVLGIMITEVIWGSQGHSQSSIYCKHLNRKEDPNLFAMWSKKLSP